MNSNVHNKKRNSMLMYEFLIHMISKTLVENNKKRQNIILNIIKKFYQPGTELYKEFRLANALYKTTVSAPSTASSILFETKNAIRNINLNKLNKEKSSLIREVNYKLNDESFYDQCVQDYRTIATIQTLFNEWYDVNNLNIEKLAEYEDKVTNWLITNKQQLVENDLSDDESGTVRIISKLLNQKFNAKYAGVLNTEQKAIIRAYTLSEKFGDDSVKTYLNEIRNNLLKKLDSFVLIENKQDDKLIEVRQSLLQEDIKDISIDTITRFLLYSQLSDELQIEGATSNDK
jgi:hypothetical protein